MSNKPKIKVFNAKNVKEDPTPFNDEGVQGLYFIADNLRNVKNEVKQFCEEVSPEYTSSFYVSNLKKEDKSVNILEY